MPYLHQKIPNQRLRIGPVPRYRLAIAIAILLATASLLFSYSCTKSSHPESDSLTFADASTVWWTGPTILAQTEKIFQKKGLTVTSFDVTTGLASKNAVLTGSADIGLVATTPLALGQYSGEKLLVLCSYVRSNSLLAFVHPNDQLQNNKTVAPTDLSGLSPVAIVPGTISEFYFRQLAKKPDYSGIEHLPQLHARPPDIPNMIAKGSAKSAVIWEPFVSLIEQSHKDVSIERDTSLYELRLYLVTRPEVFSEKADALAKFIAGVDEASRYLSTEAGRAVLEKHFSYETDWLKPHLSNTEFGIRTDFDAMKELIIQESKLAKEANMLAPDEGTLRKHDLEDLFANKDWVEEALSINK